MRTRLAVISVGVLAVLALLSVTVIGADMLTGSWKLNVAKSKYSPGPGLQSNMVRFDTVFEKQ